MSMRTVAIQDFVSDEKIQEEAGRVLREDEGLVCFPCAGTYRITACLLSEASVLELLQTKRRAKHRPALVMITSVEMLDQLADSVPEGVRRLASALWPGKVTIRLPLSQGLPRKVYKELSKPDRKVGFRQPVGEVSDLLVRAADVPLLVSSANLSNKSGAASVAAIKKHFSRSVSLFIDSGDLPAQPPSTVLDFDDQGQYKLVRSGAVSQERIEQAWSETGGVWST